MAIIKSALAAAFLIAAPMAAVAQSAPAIPNAPVVVFDYNRVLSESLAGRDAETKLRQIGETLNREAQPEQTAVQQEQEALRPLVQNQTPEQIAANATLRPRIEGLQRRMAALQQANVTRARDLEYTRQIAIRDLQRQLLPVIDEVRQQRGAHVVLDTESVARFVGGVDITQDVLTRFNQRVTSLNVTRQTAPTQQQQQQQQQQQSPAPAAAAPAAPARRR